MSVKFITAAGLPELEKKVNEALKADDTLEFHSLSHRQLAAVLVAKAELRPGAVEELLHAKPKRPKGGKRG